MDPNLKIRIGAVDFPSPVFAASGTFGYGEEFSHLLDLNEVGAVFTKGLSLEPRSGNPPPRIHETASGILNSVGLQNIGVDRFVREKLPFLAHYQVPVIANVAGESTAEFCEIVRRLESEPAVAGYELNVSCPNVSMGGMAFGTSASACGHVVSAVRPLTRKLLIVKLTPNVTDIRPIALAAEGAGADCISLINTVLGMAIDTRARRPVFSRVMAGLSGPAVKPIALRMVWEVCGCVHVPVIGIGGIETADDALQFLLAGARAVQVGTANFTDPLTIPRITGELARIVGQAGGLDRLRIDRAAY